MLKKWNWPLTFLAIANIIFIWWVSSYFIGLGQGMGIMAAIILPIYVLLFLIIITVISIVKRNTWFKKEILFSTILMLFFCTPIPLLIGFMFYSQRSITTIEEGSNFDIDSNLKTQVDIKNGKKVGIRHWKKYDGENKYVKDSIWVYFNSKGDTSRIEIYKKDSLIFEKIILH